MAISGKIVNCYCPHCEEELTTTENKIDEQPTVHLLAYQGNRVDIFLSAVWGKFKRVFVGEKIPKGTLIKALCPECEKELIIGSLLCSCGAPLIVLKSKDGILGNVYLCSRAGCHRHKIEPDIVPGETPAGA